MVTSVEVGGPLQTSTFVDRPNRFIVRCRTQPEDRLVSAHLADPGRLKELLLPGARVWLRHAGDPSRATEWSAVSVESPTGEGLVSLDTQLPNRLVAKALQERTIEEVEGWTLVRREPPIGRSRFDFLLCNDAGQQMLMEVKSVTMVEDGVGMFPDAPTDRGTRHVKKLVELSARGEYLTTLLFIVQRIDARKVTAARHIDPAFADALDEAKAAGVRIMARRCRVTLEEIVLGIPIPVE